MKNTFIICLLFLVSSCGKTTFNAELGSAFKMKSSESVKVVDTDIKLSGFTIVEDSRCPTNTNCFWEGQVIAAVDFEGTPLKISTHEVVDTLGYFFKITAVEPIKNEGDEIPLSDYILEILIIK